MSVLAIFAATFAVVLLLGLQSLNVNGGHKALAFTTSFGIGLANLYILKTLPAQTTTIELAAYLLGGPLGIVASMYLHPWLVRVLRRPTPPAARSPMYADSIPAKDYEYMHAELLRRRHLISPSPTPSFAPSPDAACARDWTLEKIKEVIDEFNRCEQLRNSLATPPPPPPPPPSAHDRRA